MLRRTENGIDDRPGNSARVHADIAASSLRQLPDLFDLFLQGRLLKGEYNALLQRLLCGTTTGANKLKAGLPAEIVIGHKTGSSDRTAEGIRIADNDAGYVLLPDGRRYCIAVFVTESEENDAANAAIAAAVSRAAYEYFSSE